jgi:hypothetical protein
VSQKTITDLKEKTTFSTFNQKDQQMISRITFCHICSWTTAVGEMKEHIESHSFMFNPQRSCVFVRQGLDLEFDEIKEKKINLIKLLECERVVKIRLQYLLAQGGQSNTDDCLEIK